MNTPDIPKLETLKTGSSFKIYKVTGQKGMEMPLHYSTYEAIVIVQKGSALLSIDGQEHLLEKGGSFIISAGKNHSLLLNKEFKSLVVTALDSKIEFVK
jgi:quercetin dioxygenase-like cupin family protein